MAHDAFTLQYQDTGDRWRFSGRFTTLADAIATAERRTEIVLRIVAGCATDGYDARGVVWGPTV